MVPVRGSVSSIGQAGCASAVAASAASWASTSRREGNTGLLGTRHDRDAAVVLEDGRMHFVHRQAPALAQRGHQLVLGQLLAVHQSGVEPAVMDQDLRLSLDQRLELLVAEGQ